MGGHAGDPWRWLAGSPAGPNWLRGCVELVRERLSGFDFGFGFGFWFSGGGGGDPARVRSYRGATARGHPRPPPLREQLTWAKSPADAEAVEGYGADHVCQGVGPV